MRVEASKKAYSFARNTNHDEKCPLKDSQNTKEENSAKT